MPLRQVTFVTKAFPAICCAALLALDRLSHADQATPLAVVAGQHITAEQVRAAVGRSGQNIYELSSATNALNEAINLRLLSAEARKIGLDKDPEVVDRVNQILIEKLVAEKIDKPNQSTPPTDAELKSSYDQHKGEFTTPGLVRAQVISIMVPAGKMAEAETKAGDAVNKLKAGTPFEQVVSLYSDDPSERMSKGLSGWFTEGGAQKRYPEALVKALFAQNSGELTSIVKTPKAIYVGKVTEKRASITRSYEEAKPALSRLVMRDRRQKAYEAYCNQLRKTFPVTVNESLLTNVVEKSRPGGPPPSGPVNVLLTPK